MEWEEVEQEVERLACMVTTPPNVIIGITRGAYCCLNIWEGSKTTVKSSQQRPFLNVQCWVVLGERRYHRFKWVDRFQSGWGSFQLQAMQFCIISIVCDPYWHEKLTPKSCWISPGGLIPGRLLSKYLNVKKMHCTSIVLRCCLISTLRLR